MSARLGSTRALTSWGLQTPQCIPHVGSQVWRRVGVATSRLSISQGGALVPPLLDGTVHTPVATGGWEGPAGRMGTGRHAVRVGRDLIGHLRRKRKLAREQEKWDLLLGLQPCTEVQ